MSHLQSQWLVPALLCAGLSCNLYAVDGIVLIDQNRALAGNVTPGDAPGFPVAINLPGSYRLSGNLTVSNAGITAILVNADNVIIDLNGFSIIGPTVCTGFPVLSCSPTGAGNGVEDVGGGVGHVGIAVVNGSVRGFGADGISLFGDGGSVEKVHVNSNGRFGIAVLHGTVSSSTAIANGSIGIRADRSTVTGNAASFNGTTGIFVLCPSSVIGNTAVSNPTNLDTSGVGCALANNAPQ